MPINFVFMGFFFDLDKLLEQLLLRLLFIVSLIFWSVIHH